MVVAIIAASGAALFTVHKYRKQAAARQALASGLEAYRAGAYGRAAADLGRYLTTDPANLDVLLSYADATMRRRPQTRGTVEQAINAWERALRLSPSREAGQRLILVYLSLEMPAEAERVARMWLAAAPDDAFARRHLAVALLSQNQTEEAIGLLRQLSEEDPGDVETAAILAYQLAHRGEPLEHVEPLLDAALAANPESLAARMARTRLYLLVGLPDRAAEELAEAETLDTDDAAVIVDFAHLLMEAGDIDRAQAQFDRAEEIAPNRLETYVARLRIAIDARDFRLGAEVADRALAAPLGEQRVDLLPLAAELYARTGRPDDARRCIEGLRGAQGSADQILYLEGLAYLAENRQERGVAALQEAAERNPRNPDPHLALGMLYAANEQPRRAIRALREYVRLDGRTATAVLVDLARLYADLDRMEDAASAASEAVSRAPTSLSARLVSLEMQGRLALRGGDAPDAGARARLQEQADHLAARHPHDARVQILQARLAAWRGSLQEAEEFLARAEALPEGGPLADAALIDIHAEAGEHDRAIEVILAQLPAAGPEQQRSLRHRLLDLYAASGDVASSRQLLETMIAELSGSERSAARLRLARLLHAQDQTDAAREQLLRIVSEDERDVAARVMLVTMPPVPGQSPSREELVAQLERIEGQDGLNWRYLRAALWLERDDWTSRRDEIESLLTACLARDPEWEDAALALGTMYELDGESFRAMQVYQRVFHADRRHVRVARRLLPLAARAGRWTDVDAILDVLPEDDPSSADHRVAQAIRRGETAAAAAMLEARAAADPTDHVARLHLASIRHDEGDTAGAERLLNQAVEIAPTAPEVVAARVQWHLGLGEREEALRICTEAIAESPIADFYQLRAGVHETAADLTEAERDLRRMAAIEGMAERAFLAMGGLYLRHGQPDRAIQHWREGLSAVPTSNPMREALAEALLGAADPALRQEGAGLLRELYTERPEDETVLLLQANHLLERDPDQAERVLDELVRLYPRSPRAYAGLARLALARGQRAGAMQAVDRGLSHNPREITLLLMKCELLLQESPHRAALVAQDALSARPGHEPAAVAYATALEQAGREREAVQFLRTFLERPGSARMQSARLTLARLLIAAGEFGESDVVISQILESESDHPGAVQLRLWWHERQQKWPGLIVVARDHQKARPDDASTARLAARYLFDSGEQEPQQAAVELLERVVTLHPDLGDAHVELGSCYYRLGQIDDAREAFERGLETATDQTGILNNLSWIISENQNDPEGALPFARKALAAQPDDPHVLDTWGVIQYRLGNIEESRRALERVVDHPRAPASTRRSATFHLARTLASVEAPRSRRLLEQLLSDPLIESTLSPDTLQEARNLLDRLSGAGGPGVSSGKSERQLLISDS